MLMSRVMTSWHTFTETVCLSNRRLSDRSNPASPPHSCPWTRRLPKHSPSVLLPPSHSQHCRVSGIKHPPSRRFSSLTRCFLSACGIFICVSVFRSAAPPELCPSDPEHLHVHKMKNHSCSSPTINFISDVSPKAFWWSHRKCEKMTRYSEKNGLQLW